MLDGKVRDRRGHDVSLYWYSQVVGLDRGLQDVIRAAGLWRGRVQLHIRGKLRADVKAELSRHASECGSADRVFFQPVVPPGELLARAAEHDIGLALEQPVNASRRLTVTNKLFFYMLAGLALAASETEGQRAILATCPAAGFLYQPGDYKALAAGLQELIDSPARLRQSKEAALRAAHERWNWEAESRKLTSLVASVWGGNGRTGA
jgi:glycosyltransferase involved in cell wall biosynthesis